MGIHSSFFLSHSRRGEVLGGAAETGIHFCTFPVNCLGHGNCSSCHEGLLWLFTVGDFDKNAGMKKTAI